MSEHEPDHQIILHNGEAMTREVTYTMGPDGETETVGPWRKVVTALDPAARSDAGDGPVLSDYAAQLVGHAFEGWAQAWWDDSSGDTLARVAVDALQEHVAALLVQARADGAAEERERIFAVLDRRGSVGALAKSHVEGGL